MFGRLHTVAKPKLVVSMREGSTFDARFLSANWTLKSAKVVGHGSSTDVPRLRLAELVATYVTAKLKIWRIMHPDQRHPLATFMKDLDRNRTFMRSVE